MEIEQAAIVIEQLFAIITLVWGEDASIIQRITAFIVAAASIVGTASILFKALDKIASVTPTTKDDKFVGKVKRWLGFLSALFDRLALNPDKSKARNAK